MTDYELREIAFTLTGLIKLLDSYPHHTAAYPRALPRIRAAAASVTREQKRRETARRSICNGCKATEKI